MDFIQGNNNVPYVVVDTSNQWTEKYCKSKDGQMTFLNLTVCVIALFIEQCHAQSIDNQTILKLEVSWLRTYYSNKTGNSSI